MIAFSVLIKQVFQSCHVFFFLGGGGGGGEEWTDIGKKYQKILNSDSLRMSLSSILQYRGISFGYNSSSLNCFYMLHLLNKTNNRALRKCAFESKIFPN